MHLLHLCTNNNWSLWWEESADVALRKALTTWQRQKKMLTACSVQQLPTFPHLVSFHSRSEGKRCRQPLPRESLTYTHTHTQSGVTAEQYKGMDRFSHYEPLFFLLLMRWWLCNAVNEVCSFVRKHLHLWANVLISLQFHCWWRTLWLLITCGWKYQRAKTKAYK